MPRYIIDASDCDCCGGPGEGDCESFAATLPNTLHLTFVLADGSSCDCLPTFEMTVTRIEPFVWYGERNTCFDAAPEEDDTQSCFAITISCASPGGVAFSFGPACGSLSSEYPVQPRSNALLGDRRWHGRTQPLRGPGVPWADPRSIRGPLDAETAAWHFG